MIVEMKDIDLDIEVYEHLMSRMPGFAPRGDELVCYLQKMLTHGKILVAENEHRLEGIIGFYANDIRSKVAYVSTFVVSKEVEGSGLSRELFERFLTSAQSSGMTDVSLNVRKDNLRAIAFYRKMGLQVIGEGRDTDHWFMKSRLNSNLY